MQLTESEVKELLGGIKKRNGIRFVDDTGLEKTALSESNRKAFKEWHTKNNSRIIKEAGEAYDLATPEKVLDFNRPNFSIKNFREAAYAVSRRTREANAESSFGQLLRAGVQNLFNDIYQAVEVTYDAVVRQAQSNKRQEFYSPLERAGFPKRVKNGSPFPETDFKGLDLELVNEKFGTILAYERELVDDDQTGQILQRASDFGVNARIQEEAEVWGVLSGQASLTFDGDSIPVSTTWPTPYVNGVPGSSGGLHGSGYGVNALGGSGYSAGRLTQGTIQSMWILGKKMLDQSGRPMLVLLDTLCVSPQDVFFATTLLNSDYNPSTASTAAGAVGGSFGINPIKNLTGIIATRFLPDYSSLMMASAKGFVFQRRDPTEIVQENPQSGPAFSQDIFRHKVRARWARDFIDPKFIINGNPNLASS